jgi:1-acyl-sn-glycerol-3-phosphate acyltransferase
MIIYLQLLFSIIVSILFFIQSSIEPLWVLILLTFGFFVAMNIAFLVAILFFFFTYVILTANSSKKAAYKQKLIAAFGSYVFEHWYRVKLVVEGKENIPKDNNFVIFSNHIDFLDPIFIFIAFYGYPVRFISKESLFKIFLVGHLVKYVNSISISRLGARTAMQAILDGIKAVNEGDPVAIFPEGTRAHGNQIAEYKAGAFKVATKPQADILPTVLYDVHSVHKKFRIRRKKVYLSILEPLKPSDYNHLDTLDIATLIHDKAQDRMNQFEQNSKKKI